MNESIRIDSPEAPEPVGAYPHARRVGNLLFLSGVGPRTRGVEGIPGVELDERGRIVSVDIRAQAHACFDNIEAVVRHAGSSWDNIVDVLVFLTNMERDFAGYNAVYAERFASNQPARTTIEVTALPVGGNAPISIEAKVIATVDG